MTEIEARGYIQGKLNCMNQCDVFNREDIKKKDLCIDCDYCYSQGNFGQQKEAFQMAINALEKQIAKKPINNKHTVSVSSTAVKVVDWWKCGKCNGDLTRQFACCPYCQTVIDWSDEE